MSSVFCLRCEAGGGEEAATFLGPREGRKVGVLKFTARVLLPCPLCIESLLLLSSGPAVPQTRTSLVSFSRGLEQGSHQLWDISLTLLYTNFQISSFQPANTQRCKHASSAVLDHVIDIIFFLFFFNSTLELLWTYILVFFFSSWLNCWHF